MYPSIRADSASRGPAFVRATSSASARSSRPRSSRLARKMSVLLGKTA